MTDKSTPGEGNGNTLKRWDNDVYEYDVTQLSKSLNPWLANYGRDRFSYRPEMPYLSAISYYKNEAR
jgi:hypothetical protein